jgi:hypothetical protein
VGRNIFKQIIKFTMRLAVRKDIKTQDFRAAMPEASETKVDSIAMTAAASPRF